MVLLLDESAVGREKDLWTVRTMLLNVKQVAEKLNVSVGCVYSLLDAGKLPCHRIGVGRGAIRIREEDLETYLAACRDEEPQPRVRVPKTRLKHLSD